MSDLVFVSGVPHNPLLWRTLAAPEDPNLIAIRDEFASFADRLRAARPDVIVVVATDHLTQWFYENMPTFLIGKSASIPATFPNEEREFGIPEAGLQGDPELGSWLLHDGIDRGIDFASSDEFRADHSILVPLHYLTPGFGVPVVPVFTNCIAPPFPGPDRFYRLGEVLRASIESCPLDRRVAVVSSGHLATEVGGPRHFAGSPDLDWDHLAVAALGDGARDAVSRLATFDRLTEAGNVTHQFLNFLVTMGVAGGEPASVAKGLVSRFATSPFFEWKA